MARRGAFIKDVNPMACSYALSGAQGPARPHHCQDQAPLLERKKAQSTKYEQLLASDQARDRPGFRSSGVPLRRYRG